MGTRFKEHATVKRQLSNKVKRYCFRNMDDKIISKRDKEHDGETLTNSLATRAGKARTGNYVIKSGLQRFWGFQGLVASFVLLTFEGNLTSRYRETNMDTQTYIETAYFAKSFVPHDVGEGKYLPLYSLFSKNYGIVLTKYTTRSFI